MKSDSIRSYKLKIRIALYVLLVLGCLVILLLPESVLFDQEKSLCLHKAIFGVECPLCGMTRATHELLHFRFRNSIMYNPAFLFIPLLLIIDFISIWSGSNLLTKLNRIVLLAFGISLLILYGYRILLGLNII